MAAQTTTREAARRDATRNPRRRQRPENESPAQPRRKRSKVADDAILPALSGHLAADLDARHTNGHNHPLRSPERDEALHMPVRGKKALQKRSTKTDASTVLTQNPHYSLRHLPSTPDIIRHSTTGFRASFLSSPTYALAVDHDHAYIWDYTSAAPVTNPKTFDLLDPSRPTDPLPLAALVTNGASTSIGLLVVAASTGKATFWENIDTAESLSLFQNRANGVQGSLGGLFSGETVVDLASADHAGYIATLSSGRIVHLALRDPQGKPHLTSQYLRSNEATGGGLFGSIKGVLGVGWKRDVVRVRTKSQGTRGQMQVISVTSAAQIQQWDLTWSGQSTFRGAIDMKQTLQTEFAKFASTQSQLASARLVDFAIHAGCGRENEVATTSEHQPLDIVMLAVSEVAGKSVFTLIDVVLSEEQAFIERMITVRGQISSSDSPRLVVPQPGHTAFIVFSTKVAIISLVPNAPDGPGGQLLMETHVPQDSFQDVLHLRQDESHIIQGYAEGDATKKHGDVSCLMLVQGFGLVRLAAAEANAKTKHKVSAKSRLEQAVCFGMQLDNVIDFTQVDRHEYSVDHVEQAAIQVSSDIVRCDAPSFTASTSVLESLDLRAQALQALVKYVRKHYGDTSSAASWALLADAEKVAAGRALWQKYEHSVQDSSMPRPTVLPTIIHVDKARTKGAKSVSATSNGPDDLRSWFVHSLDHLDRVCDTALDLVTRGHKTGEAQNLMKMLSESNDIVFAVYETVNLFRTENAAAYKIDPKMVAAGPDTRKELPEPWTSRYNTLLHMEAFIALARNYTVDFYEKPENQRESDNIYVVKVINENVRLVKVLFECYRERIAWCESHVSEDHRNYAPGLNDKFRRSREHHLQGLVKIGQAGAGLSIAEEFRDMQSLVRLVVSETAYLVESFEEAGIDHAEQEVITNRMDELQANVQRYFELFGDAWATAFFDSHLASHRSFGLFKSAETFQEPLTRYLRAEKVRGRLGWINEVLHEKDLSRAQSALTTLTREQEMRLWNKKIELSLGKLASLAAVEGQQGAKVDDKISRIFKEELDVVGVQEDIYRHLQPTVYGAIDRHAELPLLTDAYAISIRKSLPALHQLLELAFADLLSHKVLTAEQLVDVLTLMDSVPSADADPDIAGREFYLALKVLHAVRGSMEQERLETVTRIVWKRLFIADEWDVLTSTKGKSEADVQEQIRESTVCQTIALVLQDDDLPTLNIPQASTCQGAGSSAGDLAHRFPSSDLRDPIIHDNAVQDGKLAALINKHDGLDKWIAACRKEAEKMIAEERAGVQADEATFERVRRRVLDVDRGLVDRRNGSGSTTGDGLLRVTDAHDDGPSFEDLDDHEHDADGHGQDQQEAEDESMLDVDADAGGHADGAIEIDD